MPARAFRIVNERTGETVSSRGLMADKPWTRMKGLLGKKGLPPGESIILRPCSSIHTYFMRFPLDVLFLDKDGRIVKVVRDLKPYRLSAAKGARDAIEMQAGSFVALDLAPGDTVRFEALG